MRRWKSAGGKQTLYFKSGEIDQICETELRDAGLLPEFPSAIDIELLIESHLECSLDYGDIPNGVLGYTLFDESGKPERVGVSPNLLDGSATGLHRNRSTLAHEAGHCVLHPSLFTEEQSPALGGENVDYGSRRILCRDEDFRRTKGYDGRWWEYQANCAIGGFLLPVGLVNLVVEPFTRKCGIFEMRVLEGAKRDVALRELVEVFEVSFAAAQIRLSMLFPKNEAQQFL